MSKDPAVLLYTSDLLTGMTLMSYEERGQYITLLCQQHQIGHLPFNHMISVCGSQDSVVISKFVQDSEGLYYNERMEEEIQKRASFCKSRSHKGKSGRKKKSYENHTKIIRNAIGNRTEDENENEDKVFLKEGGKGGEVAPEDKTEQQEKSAYENFKQAYPANGSALNPNVKLFVNRIETIEPSTLLKILRRADEYASYCKTSYPDEYPHGQYIMQAENWLKKRQWEIPWSRRIEKPAAVNLSKMTKEEKIAYYESRKPQWLKDKEKAEGKKL